MALSIRIHSGSISLVNHKKRVALVNTPRMCHKESVDSIILTDSHFENTLGLLDLHGPLNLFMTEDVSLQLKECHLLPLLQKKNRHVRVTPIELNRCFFPLDGFQVEAVQENGLMINNTVVYSPVHETITFITGTKRVYHAPVNNEMEIYI